MATTRIKEKLWGDDRWTVEEDQQITTQFIIAKFQEDEAILR